MEVDRLSHHPCHRLSVPAAKLFWCRHCMEKFEDPISRWRHSKTCKTEGTLNMNKRKEQEAEAFKLFVESTAEPEQEIEVETSPQPVAAITPPEKLPNPTQQTGTDLNCFICKKEFTSLNEMRAHVRTPCNKQDKNSDVYNSFPFITESFAKDSQSESTHRMFVNTNLDSLFSKHSTDNSQSREEVLITKLLSQWSQQKVSHQQPSKEIKYQSHTHRNSTVTSLHQTPKYTPIQSNFVLDSVNGDECISSNPITETCSQNKNLFHDNSDENTGAEVIKDCVQLENNSENHEILETDWNSQADLMIGGVNVLPNKKRKLTDLQMDSSTKRQRVDSLSNEGVYKKGKGTERQEVDSLSNDETRTGFNGDLYSRQVSHEEKSDNTCNGAGKPGLKQLVDPDLLEIKEGNVMDCMNHISRNNCSIVHDVNNGEIVNTDKCLSSIGDASGQSDLTISMSLEQSDKENNKASSDASSHVPVDEKSVPLKMFRPVRTISSVVYPVLNNNYNQDKIPKKEFTVVRTEETVTAGKSLGSNSSTTKSCSMKKYNAVKISKNKPKPVRAVIPVINTAQTNLSQDDSDNDSVDNVNSKHRIYPPSPAKTRSKNSEFCLIRSTARTYKPTKKRLELMVEPKSKSKVQSNAKKQSAIKDDVLNKKTIKKAGKIPEKHAVKKLSVVKETKIADKKPKSSKKSATLHHELKTEKSKSKPPKNLKCRLCDRVFDSVKQYQNHTRIPCKMKITRTWSQKVLRPKRSLPPSMKEKPTKKKNRDPKRPNIIPSCFRIHSQWEPTKRIRKPSKVKNRPVSPQLSIVISSKEKRPLPHLQIDVSDLTDKELFLYKFGLMCADDLPLYMYVTPRVHSVSGSLAVSVDSSMSDIFDCNISPPVLERIDIDDHTEKPAVTNPDMSFNLEPPHLIPAVQSDCVTHGSEVHSVHNMLAKCITESVHDVSMNKIKHNMKSSLGRRFTDVLSITKKAELDSNMKDIKELTESSPCKVFNSPRNSLSTSKVNQLKSGKMETFSQQDLNGCNLSLSENKCSNGKVIDVDLVTSPRRKEKRNLFETLSWEMLSKNSDLPLSGTKPTSLPQKLADQMDKDILGFLSKGLGIQTPNSTFASPNCMLQQKSQHNFVLQPTATFPSVLQQQSPTKVLQPTSVSSPMAQWLTASPMAQKMHASPVAQRLPTSPVSQISRVSPLSQMLPASQWSPNLSCKHPSAHRSSPVLIPSPRLSTNTKQAQGIAHQHRISPRCPQDSHNGIDSNSLIKIPVKEKSNKNSQCNGQEIIISKSTEINIRHIVRKLQFNLCEGVKTTSYNTDTALVSNENSADEVDGSLDSSLVDNILNNDIHVQVNHGNSQQKTSQILHKNESDKSSIEEVLADIVQKICNDSYRHSRVCLRKDEENLETFNGNLKDGSVCISAQNKRVFSNQLCFLSPSESQLGATVMSCVSNSDYHMDTENKSHQTEDDMCVSDTDFSRHVNTENKSHQTEDDMCVTVTDSYHVDTENKSHQTEDMCVTDTDDICLLNEDHDMCDERKGEIITAELEESSEHLFDHQTPEVTVEYVDHITSAMLDDSEDVTYIIIEQDDMGKYSLKDITSADDDITTSSCVSVS